jgi:hypothetical protein
VEKTPARPIGQVAHNRTAHEEQEEADDRQEIKHQFVPVYL